MELVDVVEAVAHLSEQIDELRAEQSEQNRVTGENLRQWSEINAKLMECFLGQSKDYRTSANIQQMLAQHLLTLAQTTQQLTGTTLALKGSSQTLTRYLEEEQALQLQHLSESHKQLQASSSKLENYLVTEQSKRLNLLESGLRSLLEMLEASQTTDWPLIDRRLSSQNPTTQSQRNRSHNHQSPGDQNHLPATPTVRSAPKKWSFDLSELIPSALIASATTACLLLFVWQVGGVGKELAHIAERSEWSIIKLERLESVLELE